MRRIIAVLPVLALLAFFGFQANAAMTDSGNGGTWDSSYNMMPWMSSWAGGFWMWVVGASLIVWFGVGILLFAWLWKQMMKK